VKLCGNGVANLSIEFLNTLDILKPVFLFNCKNALEVIDGKIVAGFDFVIKACEVNVLSLRYIADRCLNTSTLSSHP
jgi:hypothetical protein